MFNKRTKKVEESIHVKFNEFCDSNLVQESEGNKGNSPPQGDSDDDVPITSCHQGLVIHNTTITSPNYNFDHLDASSSGEENNEGVPSGEPSEENTIPSTPVTTISTVND